MSGSSPTMNLMRSLLFVPGNRQSWIEKILTYKADAYVVDLEDSVPAAAKADARKLVAKMLPDLIKAGKRIYVRVNKTPYVYDLADLEAVIMPGLEGIFVGKTEGPEDIDTLSTLMSEFEFRRGMKVGQTLIVPGLETARGLELCYDIAIRDRVGTLIGSHAKGADIAKAIGFQWTPQGLETLYLRSKVNQASRAAGKIFPMAGLWQEVHDLKGLREFCKFNRQLGFMGEIVLHPSNAEIVNEIYTPDEKELKFYRGLVEAFDLALKENRGAVIYEGEHIDYAHYHTAKQLLSIFKDIVK